MSARGNFRPAQPAETLEMSAIWTFRAAQVSVLGRGRVLPTLRQQLLLTLRQLVTAAPSRALLNRNSER
jgi:hypothetical protein